MNSVDEVTRPIRDNSAMNPRKPVQETRVAIVGGGLTGSLCASILARRGYDVNLYEYREDIRTTDLARGRSINLALSARGRTALREIGLEQHIVQEHGIAMRARMIHNIDGSKYAIPYDAVNNQCIYSVGRKYLNEVLLSEAEKYPNMRTKFSRKLIRVNLEDVTLTFLCTRTNQTFEETADFVIGADGAYSHVRKELTKRPLYNFSQEYIDHGYLELCIPPTDDGDFAMEPNYLHIWPRGTFMMIALPNQDKTWTVTLFMPFKQFDALNDSDKLLRFFESYFPDSIPLITKGRLLDDFFAAKPSALISIKCKPYHFKDKVLIIGDAAHAMVPFYGQGMNAGFEDCVLLNQLMSRHQNRLDRVFPEFSATRNPDAEAICDLAKYNYIEMRDLVNKKSFLLGKKLDNVLYRMFPKVWMPLYNSVTFTDMKYSHCVQNKKNRDKIVAAVLVLLVAELLWCLYSIWEIFAA